MSAAALHEFWNTVEADAGLAAELDALFTGEANAASADSIVALAARHGFGFSRIELKQYIVTGGELSDSELDEAAGGATGDIFDKLGKWVGNLKDGTGTVRTIHF